MKFRSLDYQQSECEIALIMRNMYLNNFHYNYNNKKLFLPMNQSRPSYLSDFIHVVQSLNSCHSETTNFNRISNTGRINQVHYHTCPSSIYLWTESPDNGPAINETTKFPPKATKSVCSLTHTYSALSQCPSSLSLSLYSLSCVHTQLHTTAVTLYQSIL